MDESTLELHEGYEPLKHDLRALVQALLALDPRGLRS